MKGEGLESVRHSVDLPARTTPTRVRRDLSKRIFPLAHRCPRLFKQDGWGWMTVEMDEREPWTGLYERPGYLVRRAHQIMDASFMDAMADLALTPAQYGALFIIEAQNGIDQASVARKLRFDRSTTGLIVANLEKRGLIARSPGTEDKRRRILCLTEPGKALLEIAHVRGAQARAQAMSIYAPGQEEQLVALLDKFVRAWEDAPERDLPLQD